jgi:hypothetical protein
MALEVAWMPGAILFAVETLVYVFARAHTHIIYIYIYIYI